MIKIVDYGVGNIQAFITVFKRMGISIERAHVPEDLLDARYLILSGVGAFDPAMNLLNRSGMRDKLEEMVLGQKVPILGVCVGMQLLASGSDEGVLPGLNWIPGRVRTFLTHSISKCLPMPHMGWNNLNIKYDHNLLTGLGVAPKFYFLHSYYFDCDDPACVMATSEYGFHFSSIVFKENIYGVQCHPEKSHQCGIQLLKNFSGL